MGRVLIMELKHAARCLEKTGNPTRLAMFRLLVRVGPAGLALGEIQEHLAIPRRPGRTPSVIW